MPILSYVLINKDYYLFVFGSPARTDRFLDCHKPFIDGLGYSEVDARLRCHNFDRSRHFAVCI